MYELIIKMNDNSEDDLLFVEFEVFDELMDFLKIFQKHSNILVEFTINSLEKS